MFIEAQGIQSALHRRAMSAFAMVIAKLLNYFRIGDMALYGGQIQSQRQALNMARLTRTTG
jgi:hypothetical protein